MVLQYWAAALLAAFVAAACAVDDASAPPKTPTRTAATASVLPPQSAGSAASLTEARVARVIDGDTIEVELDGRLLTVRYIGIDTPETVHPTRPVEPYGQEASERNRQLVEGKSVLLERDISETDRFGRLLRYVYVDGVMVNEVLVREGYARVSVYPPDQRHAVELAVLEREAIRERLGLWSAATQAGDGGSDADAEFLPGNVEMPGDCAPAYPTVCIPPPYLNCGDVPYHEFEVRASDPHGFDGDGDGIGCEG